MLASSFDGMVPAFTVEGAESDLPSVTAHAVAGFQLHMLRVELSPALVDVWDIVARANHFLVEKEPWKIKDAERRDELGSVLYAAAETLRIVAILIQPIMPSAAGRLWSQLGIAEPLHTQRLPDAAVWGGLAPGTRTTKGEALFPRLDAD